MTKATIGISAACGSSAPSPGMAGDMVRSHRHGAIAGVSDVTASNVSTDMLKDRPIGQE